MLAVKDPTSVRETVLIIARQTNARDCLTPSRFMDPRIANHDPFVRLSTSVLLALVLSIQLSACSASSNGSFDTRSPSSARPQRIYMTSFSVSENPLSESGNWVDGGRTGLDWASVQTASGLAFGTESGSGGYDDSTAVLTGNWSPDQMAQAVVHTTNQNSKISEEVELRLRTTITAHRITGYEINFKCTTGRRSYVQIVRWNGPFGNFTFLKTLHDGPGLREGDVIRATVIGSTITAYINGKRVLQATDKTYDTGSPGIGFFNADGTRSIDADYGFTKFIAQSFTTN